MIFPVLNGILGLRAAPVTWLLAALNAAIMTVTLSLHFESQNRIEAFLRDDFFLKVTGQLFSQYIERNNQEYPATLREHALIAGRGDVEKTQILGSLAIRDARFMGEARTVEFKGDPVAHKWWRQKMDELTAIQAAHPSYIFGLNSEDVSWSKWITYQFVHSGAMHFVGNMIFLMIFGSVLEPLIGGLALMVVYLGSGMMAAGVFLTLSGLSSIPLVGASGAVSGLMALFCFMFWSQRVRYAFFLFIPKKGYGGFIFLPGWVTLVMWVLSDLAGFFGTMDELGGVAHAAHLGGEMSGLLVGLAVYFLRYQRPRGSAPVSASTSDGGSTHAA